MAVSFSFRRRMWIQEQVTLRPRPRGFHLITDEVFDGVPELRSLRIGLALVFMQHTSASLTLPVRDGRPALGTWQGIYLCEHRDDGGPRRLIVTAFGET